MVGVVFVFFVVFWRGEKGLGFGGYLRKGEYIKSFLGGGGMYNHKYSLKHKNDINGHP